MDAIGTDVIVIITVVIVMTVTVLDGIAAIEIVAAARKCVHKSLDM